MWITSAFHQVSMFSLKPSDATSTGGKSLLVPSPYSIKMALLDRALRSYGREEGRALFPLLRDLLVAMNPPPSILVNNCFVRIQKQRRSASKQGKEKITSGQDDEHQEAEEENLGPYVRSVAFREYVQYSGPLGIAISVETREDAERLQYLLTVVNYFGKRGSLFQIDDLPVIREELPTQQGYFRLDEELVSGKIDSGTLLQILDDMDEKMTFDQVNVYSTKLSVGKERQHRPVALPYRVAHSGHDFTHYQRTDGPDRM